jgi:hypothetical protein
VTDTSVMLVGHLNVQRAAKSVERFRLQIAIFALLAICAGEAWLLSRYPSNWPGHNLVASQRCYHTNPPSLQAYLDPCTNERYGDGHLVKRALDGHIIWQGPMPMPYMPETQCNSWAQCGEK